MIQIPPVDAILDRRQMLLVIETFEEATTGAAGAATGSTSGSASGATAREGAFKPKETTKSKTEAEPAAQQKPEPKPKPKSEPKTDPKPKRKRTKPAKSADKDKPANASGWTMKDRFLALCMIGMIGTGAYVWIADVDTKSRNFPSTSDLAWLNTPERRAEKSITFTPFEGVRLTSLDTSGQGKVLFAGIDNEDHGFVTRFDTTANSYTTPARTVTKVKTAHVLMDARGRGISFAAFAAYDDEAVWPYVYLLEKDGQLGNSIDINEDRFILATAPLRRRRRMARIGPDDAFRHVIRQGSCDVRQSFRGLERLHL